MHTVRISPRHRIPNPAAALLGGARPRCTSTAATSTPRCSRSGARWARSRAPRPRTAPPPACPPSPPCCSSSSARGHVVASRCLYGGTHALLAGFLPRSCGVSATFVDVDDEAAVRAAVRAGETKVLYVETMTNPTLAVADIPMLARVARGIGVTLVVDNTFTPMVVSPARLGADVVLHSVSKFISGGADIIAGAICGSAKLVKAMMDLQDGALMLLGPTMNAKVAFELSERLPHLPLRMREHSWRAAA